MYIFKNKRNAGLIKTDEVINQVKVRGCQNLLLRKD